jgi:hypothetical protein
VGNNFAPDSQIIDTRGHLAGILAERKVCKALQDSNWPDAVYSPPEDDLGNARVDIIVPLKDRCPLGIQVKGIQRLKGLSVKWKEELRVAWVNTPMHEAHSPFKLNPAHTRFLARKIARFIDIDSLQTEVDGVELAAA